MSALAHRSATERPPAKDRLTISSGVSNSYVMGTSLFAQLHMVKRLFATRPSAGECALILGMNGDDREAVRQFLLTAAAAMQTDLTGLARAAGMAPSTVTRFVNNPDTKHVPSTRTLLKISKVSGVPMPDSRPRELSRGQQVRILAAVAEAVGLTLPEAALLAGVSDVARLNDWIDVIRNLPATAQDQALEMLRGVAETIGAAKQESGPSESLGRRRNS